MKILQVNKFLYGGSGSETVMFRTAALLREQGHDVSFFAMQDPRNEPCAESAFFPPGRYYSADAGRLAQIRGAASSIYSLQSRRALRRLLETNRPDLAHLHNVYHQLTLSVVDELAAQSVPIVMTVHDYKPVCPSYRAFAEHEPCHRCITGHPGHVIAHRCIKESRAASGLAAIEAGFTRIRKVYHRIGTFIVPSRCCAGLLVAGGLPANRMRVIPNFVADDQFQNADDADRAREPLALFVGRLEEPKGLGVLLAAAERLKGTLKVAIVGEGPMLNSVQAASNAGTVEYLGRRDWPQIASLMDRACALVMPALSEENCPMVVLEAGARGCPAVVSDRGGQAELVSDGRDGLVYPATDPGALAQALARLAADSALTRRLGINRRQRTLEQHSAASYLRSLLDVYFNSIVAPMP